MKIGGVDVRWAPRLRPEKLRRLYDREERGLLDEELLDEVAFGLYSRCESVLMVTESIAGKTRCPRCACGITPEGGRLRCPQCAWEASRQEYHRTWEHQQLNGTSARSVFEEFVRALPHAATPQAKMLLIDKLIHACHRDARRGTTGRQVARNLIEGSSRTIRELFDGLAYGDQAPPDAQKA